MNLVNIKLTALQTTIACNQGIPGSTPGTIIFLLCLIMWLSTNAIVAHDSLCNTTHSLLLLCCLPPISSPPCSFVPSLFPSSSNRRLQSWLEWLLLTVEIPLCARRILTVSRQRCSHIPVCSTSSPPHLQIPAMRSLWTAAITTQ